jgi:hypothetical protein
VPNLILEDSVRMPYFTNMRLVFDALPGICSQHEWLISNLECAPVALDTDGPWPLLDPRLESSPVFLTGQELETILASNTIQFSWAVFSGVPVGSNPNPSEAPYADGNPDFWHGSPKPQLDGAELEIVCWDSSCCLIIGASEELAAKFRAAFPEVLDLDQQNRRRPSAPRP